MKIQTNAVNVLERTSNYLNSGVLKTPPAWFNVVAKHPPRKQFTREPVLNDPVTGKSRVNSLKFKDGVNRKGLYKTRANLKDKTPSTNRLYKPVNLVYLEDQLRQLFYEQHPWERSRPKILIENTNMSGRDYDWSQMQQLGKPLDGESVVQRSLYLLKNKKCSSLMGAYDQARFEFYRIRMEQEIKEQVAMEEAEMFGSIMGPSAIDFGIEKEQEVIGQWKKKVIKETELLSARRANPSESWSAEETGSADNKKTEKVDEKDEIEELLL